MSVREQVVGCNERKISRAQHEKKSHGIAEAPGPRSPAVTSCGRANLKLKACGWAGKREGGGFTGRRRLQVLQTVA